MEGIEPDYHPYGACYHDLAEKMSTGLIEVLKCRGIEAVIVGGLATDYCVKNTALQLKRAGFEVILNLSACRGIADQTISEALEQLRAEGVIIIQSIEQLHTLIQMDQI